MNLYDRDQLSEGLRHFQTPSNFLLPSQNLHTLNIHTYTTVDYLPTYCRLVLYSLILSTKSFCTGSSSLLNATAVKPMFLLKETKTADWMTEVNLKSLWRIMVILLLETSTRMWRYFKIDITVKHLLMCYSGHLILLIATELKSYQNSVNTKNSHLTIAPFPSLRRTASFLLLNQKAPGPSSS